MFQENLTNPFNKPNYSSDFNKGLATPMLRLWSQFYILQFEKFIELTNLDCKVLLGFVTL